MNKPKEITISIYEWYGKDIDFLEEAVKAYISSGTRSSEFIKTVIFLATTLEQVLKYELMIVNPALVFDRIDDTTFDYLKDIKITRKSRSGSANPPEQKVRTSNLNILIRRYFSLHPREIKYSNYLKKIIELRNKIVHGDLMYKIKISEHEINIALAESFEFIKTNFTRGRLPKNFWVQVDTLKRHVKDIQKQRILKKIEEAKISAAHLKRQEVEARKIIPYEIKQVWGPQEEEVIFNLPCPACGNESINLVLGPDTWDDYGIGVIEQRESKIYCRVCRLEFSESEYREVSNESSFYKVQQGWANNLISMIDEINQGKIPPEVYREML